VTETSFRGEIRHHAVCQVPEALSDIIYSVYLKKTLGVLATVISSQVVSSYLGLTVSYVWCRLLFAVLLDLAH